MKKRLFIGIITLSIITGILIFSTINVNSPESIEIKNMIWNNALDNSILKFMSKN